jgi:hypothetical protein
MFYLVILQQEQGDSNIRITSNNINFSHSRETTTAGSRQQQGRQQKQNANNSIDARNAEYTTSRTDLNNSRKGSNSRGSNYSRDSRDKTTALRTHQQQA